MAMTSDERVRLHRSRRREYTVYFAAIYPLLLVIALLSRLLPRRLRPFSFQGRSVFGEARAAAHTVLPFLFMG